MDLSDSLEQLRWASFEVTLRAEEHLRLPPYKGSTLRGAFGTTFKRLVCVMPHRNCDICLLRQQCVYAVDFETRVQMPGSANPTYVPHPFVIGAPLDERTDYAPGDTFTFGLVLIGRAVEHLPYFIYTLDQTGKAGIGRGRGKCAIEEVRHIRRDGSRTVVYDGAAKQLLTGWTPTSGVDLKLDGSNTSAVLSFLTPTRMRIRNDLLMDLDFETLIRALLRRVSSLARHHCGTHLDLDYQGMVSRAKEVRTSRRDLRWYDWERYSARQDTTMKLGGFVGHIAFEGDMAEFLPLLRIGEHLHVGKGTAFGLGRYRIAEEERVG